MNLSLLDFKFVAILAVVGFARAFVPVRHYTFYALISSAALLAVAAPTTLLAIVATTLLLVYPAHRLMQWTNQATSGRLEPRFVLIGAIVALVALMLGFKLFRHFSLPGISSTFIGTEILGLIGFSYYLFKAIGFLHINYLTKTTEDRPWSLLLFSLFPPTLTSGPIQKYQDFRKQLNTPEPVSRSLLCEAGYRITRGYFRKLVVAILLDGFTQRLLGMEHPTVYLSVLTIAVLYLYFYFDFSGYSDIAVGFGLMLGIRVPENFRKPFQATTVSEFWRNWHITLADWFRDQVFIPFGGMSSSRVRAAALGLLIMLICGLWHGLTLSFVSWGIWHGLVLFTEGISGAKPVPPAMRHGPKYWARVLWTNSRIAVGAVFFLPLDSTHRLLSGFLNWSWA